MTSYLHLTSSPMPCFTSPQTPCFRLCWVDVSFTPTSATTANFGPRYAVVSSYGGSCECTGQYIYGATVTANTASGSSPGGYPFSRVQMVGYSSSNSLTISWTANFDPYINQTCATSYYVAGGPPVLGADSYYFSEWWAILVGVICFIVICCICAISMGVCASICGRRSKTPGTTLQQPQHTVPPPVAETVDFSTYTADRPQYAPPPFPPGQYGTEAIPVATAIPVPVGATHAPGEPVLVAQPVDQATSNHNAHQRQVTIV